MRNYYVAAGLLIIAACALYDSWAVDQMKRAGPAREAAWFDPTAALARSLSQFSSSEYFERLNPRTDLEKQCLAALRSSSDMSYRLMLFMIRIMITVPILVTGVHLLSAGLGGQRYLKIIDALKESLPPNLRRVSN